MCVPFAHKKNLGDLKIETRIALMEDVNRAVQVLQALYQPEGFNVGINLGKVAGAGVAEHLHIHIVPRWGGDTSFITSVGQTRVLPEALENTYQRVKEAWESY
jgi:ATP adenylyltransferase